MAYLVVYEDSTIDEVDHPPTADDLEAIRDGLMYYIRARNGHFEVHDGDKFVPVRDE